jgi:hypothetical protein
MSDDPAQDYCADGRTEDLITDLSKVSDLFVIARNSTLTYTSKTATIRQVAEKFPDRADILAPSSGCVPNKRLLRVRPGPDTVSAIWAA